MCCGERLEGPIPCQAVIVVSDREGLRQTADPGDSQRVGDGEEDRSGVGHGRAGGSDDEVDIGGGGKRRQTGDTRRKVRRNAGGFEIAGDLPERLAKRVRQHTGNMLRQRGDGGGIGGNDRLDAVSKADIAQEPDRPGDEQILHRAVEGDLLHSGHAIVERIDRRIERLQPEDIAGGDKGAGDIDRRDLWKTPTSGVTPVQLTKGEGLETEPAPLASGNKVAVFYADARRPRCVALVPAQGGEAKIVNPALPADFPLDAQVVPEAVLLKAEDGLELHTQVFVPKDIKPGERRPAVLFTHGGPGRQMLLGYHYMFFYHMAYAMNQYFAAQGYVVISVNYRSGIGYGREFRMAPGRGAAGSSEYQDVVAAGKYLQSRPDVDPERIGLYGLSYGGLLTAMGLSRNSDIFKAGVDIAGVHLWGNSIDTNSTAFKASSVATVDKWTSPVLLVQGDDDRNVAFSQTTSLVQLLRARNIYHELIVFPDEVHDFLVWAKWIQTFQAADDFFKRFLKK